MTIGDKIKAARRDKGLTQKELGDKLGVSASMIGQYETGNRNPKFETIQEIASALGIGVSEIMDITPISSSLNSAIPLIEDIFTIQKNPNNSKGEICLSPDEREKFLKLFELLHNAEHEIENSEYFIKPLKERYITAFDKLNLEGKYQAVLMIDKLSEIPEYQRKDK